MVSYMDPVAFNGRFDPNNQDAGVSYGPIGFGGYFAPAPQTANGAGVLSGQPAPGALSGQGGGMGMGGAGILQNLAPTLATIGGGLLAARGVGANAAAMIGPQMPALSQDLRKRSAINSWLAAQSQGGQIDPATLKVLQSDPELAQNLLAARMTPHRQFGQIGVDAMGNAQYGFADPFNETVTPASAVMGGAGGGAAMGGGAAPASGGQPASPHPTYDALGTFPGLQQQADAIIDGRMAPYTQRAASSPGTGRAVMQAVYERDPSYDQGRYDTRQSFEHGKDADTITFGRTAMGHLNDVSAAADKLKPFAAASGLPFASYLANHLNNEAIMGSGTPEAQALAAYQSATQKYSAEATKFYAGTGGGEGDREEAEHAFDAAKSPAEIQAAAKMQADLIESKVSALQGKWHAAMGKGAPDFEIVRKEDQANLDAVRGRYQRASGGNVPEGATATNAKTGHRIVMKGGQWLDAQTGQPVQ